MKALLFSALTALLAFSVVACGDDDDDDETTPTLTPTPTGETSPTGDASPTGEGSPTATEPASPTPSPENDEPFEGDTEPVSQEPGDATMATLAEVRLGEHEQYDRFVIEFDDPLPGYEVRYVDEATECGSGMPVDLEGDAILHVQVEPATAHNDEGETTIESTEIDGPGATILEAVQSCDFEGVVAWELGVPAERPFRVTELESPPRLVVDVGHEE